MTYDGLVFTEPRTEAHLGGNITVGDPFTHCPSVWNHVIDRFAVRSVLDVGSGVGTAAAHFHRQGLQVVAMDGFAENVAGAVFPTVQHDLTTGPFRTRVDLVHCQEVVEHIEARFLPHLLETFACGRLVLMTHALPGQQGHHHVNLQPAEYWVAAMSGIGFSHLVEDSARIRSLAAGEGAKYMAQTGLLFARARLRG